MAQHLMPFLRQTCHGSTIGLLTAFLFGHKRFVAPHGRACTTVFINERPILRDRQNASL